MNDELISDSINQVNSDFQKRVEPLKNEARELKRKVQNIDSSIGRYVKALGQGKISAKYLEKEIGACERDKIILEQRLEEIERLINEYSVSELNADFIRQNVSKFGNCYSALEPKEQAEMLQCLIKQAILGQNKITLEIFELPELVIGSKNRSKWYPRQDDYRTFQPVVDYLKMAV